jgi:regulator of nucleoside diphosphate kinase
MHATLHDRKPVVRIADADYERLENLSRLPGSGADMLAGELERARVVPDNLLAAEAPFVRLGGRVEYFDLLSGRVREVQLSVPEDADIDAGRLSVLSPVGAALVGLSEGDRFSWTGDDGRPRVIVVQRVLGYAASPTSAPLAAEPA